MAVSLTGCTVTSPTPAPAVADRPDEVERLTALRAEARRWAGTPHRWGGTDTSGIDCSALVQLVYRDAFAMDVPRTTEDQVRIGTQVDRGALRVGDLVFFKTGRTSRHVGVYLGDGEFLHASRSLGVATSHLDETYWARHYWTSRRVLPASIPPTRATPAPLSDPTTPGPPDRRTGW